jgi:hypothetical protein
MGIDHEDNIEGFSNLIGEIIQIVMCTVFLNTSWLVTSLGTIIMLWATFAYYVVVYSFPVYPWIMQFITFTGMLVYLTYFTELMMKTVFLESKVNMIMH